ncbi:MAG: response regulator transcription factor [Spirochaetales bacterium]|nr:response regulator transcription factor [Spirochaetales bacterium]
MTRIMIADDQNLFIESLKMVIENCRDDFKVVATASNGKEVLEILELEKVDVILMDIQMPIMDGVQATRLVKSKYPGIKIIMLTTHDEQQLVQDALAMGAAGFLLKSISPEVLFASIDAVNTGSILMSPGVAGKLMEILSGTNPSIRKKIKEELPFWYQELKGRDRHILKLMIQGFNNSEIAEEIHVAPQTIRNYISRIYSLLEVDDRRDAINKAATIDSVYYE